MQSLASCSGVLFIQSVTKKQTRSTAHCSNPADPYKHGSRYRGTTVVLDKLFSELRKTISCILQRPPCPKRQLPKQQHEKAFPFPRAHFCDHRLLCATTCRLYYYFDQWYCLRSARQC